MTIKEVKINNTVSTKAGVVLGKVSGKGVYNGTSVTLSSGENVSLSPELIEDIELGDQILFVVTPNKNRKQVIFKNVVVAKTNKE